MSEASIVQSIETFECASVLLVGFNRPDFMASQIAAIRSAAPKKLYIAVDGPRPGRDGEVELCCRVQECVSLVDWSCDIKTLFRDKNLGCKLSISSAITWFFEHEEEGIILEDDCAPTLDFFRFATAMLKKYRNDERVGAINGFNFFNLQSDTRVSYHFSRHMDVWGWASWRRVWEKYDVENYLHSTRFEKAISSSKMTRYYKKVFFEYIKRLENGLSTWDVQLSLLFLAEGYLSVVPKERLISNTGLSDNRATHTSNYVYWADKWIKTGKADNPIVDAVEITPDEKADYIREKMEGAFLPRVFTYIGSKMPCLIKAITLIGKILEKCCPILFRL